MSEGNWIRIQFGSSRFHRSSSAIGMARLLLGIAMRRPCPGCARYLKNPYPRRNGTCQFELSVFEIPAEIWRKRDPILQSIPAADVEMTMSLPEIMGA